MGPWHATRSSCAGVASMLTCHQRVCSAALTMACCTIGQQQLFLPSSCASSDFAENSSLQSWQSPCPSLPSSPPPASSSSCAIARPTTPSSERQGRRHACVLHLASLPADPRHRAGPSWPQVPTLLLQRACGAPGHIAGRLRRPTAALPLRRPSTRATHWHHPTLHPTRPRPPAAGPAVLGGPRPADPGRSPPARAGGFPAGRGLSGDGGGSHTGAAACRLRCRSGGNPLWWVDADRGHRLHL